MTHIWAKGKVDAGLDLTARVDVYGDEKSINSIECQYEISRGINIPCDPFLMDELMSKIHKPVDYYIVPYIPAPDTMQAAVAAIAAIWGKESVHVEGEIEEVPFDPNVIY